jgi:hypothetical protein
MFAVRKPQWVGRGRSWCVVLVAALASCWFAAHDAQAVIIALGDGSGNTSPPPDDPGWSHVGRYGDFSAVYLGNRWALAADHVPLAPEVVLGDQAFAVIPETTVTLRNPPLSQLPDARAELLDEGTRLTEFTDLRLVRLQEDPGLPPLTIASEPPSFVDTRPEVIMMGHGRNREPSLTTWQIYDLGGEEYEWDELGPAGPQYAEGYQYAPGQSQRWGTNTIVADALYQSADRDVLSLITQFNRGDELTTEFEAQAAVGDSGGPLFHKSEQGWELVGVMLLVGQAPGQPADTAVLGNLTVSADLSIYRDQIMETISPVLRAGDANQDFSFDQLDIVRVLQAGKYLTQEVATWGEGDWDGAPGGLAGSPPLGNGLFDQRDIVAALQTGLYLSGPYRAAIAARRSHAVPEPYSRWLAGVAALAVAAGWRSRHGRASVGQFRAGTRL